VHPRQLLELGDDFCVPSADEIRFDALLDRVQPQVLEARRLDRHERMVGDVPEGLAPPEGKRVTQQSRRSIGPF
jgi:hypothetical protein